MVLEEPLPGHPVAVRRGLFRRIASAADAMGLVLRDRKPYEPREFAQHAQELVELATQPWAFFPTGSDYAPSRANPAVWTAADAFRQEQQRFEEATVGLLQAARSENMTAIRAAHDQVIERCRACHYRFHRN